MDYKIAIGQEVRDVEIDSSDNADVEEYVALVKGGKRGKAKITILRRDKDRVILSVEGKVYSIIQLERTQTAVSFIANGRRVTSRTGSLETEHHTSSLIATANELVASNFPAKIVKLPVKEGDTLKEGDALIVLEAMKMEAQIKAPRDCVVEEIFVKEGDMVGRGKALIRLKFR